MYFLDAEYLILQVTRSLCAKLEQVQFLDRHHLLIKFGSVDGGVSSIFLFFHIILTVGLR